MRKVSKKQVRKLIGKSIYAVRQDGSVVRGKLIRIQGNTMYVAPIKKSRGKTVQTKFIFALALFSIVAIGALAFSGCGCGGFGCGGFGGGCFGGPGFKGGFGGF
ncbi:hypothetical protein [Paenibacillus sp. GXUN7292]|uniref:hypothetical protein n=1 Tax=Paenibacillus sp. GXUN7292 TaxID=3422499 RepID=UPI003D7EC010